MKQAAVYAKEVHSYAEETVESLECTTLSQGLNPRTWKAI
ncbi:hypothetical protein T11_1928 [Trichinella zimbabwensis]|uniref:Uncharacterized protein n=1 Tax=Trichinella zimbabwensis TaxID=268475 RepID=A0A0V1F313_9BILA|nr:hypothetical protein T11_1928 [Trichinella zimbabwensis]